MWKHIWITLLALCLQPVQGAPTPDAAASSDRMCADEGLCRRCDGPACAIVAEAVAWPDERVEDGLALHLLSLCVVLPGKPDNLLMLTGTLVARYSGGRSIEVTASHASQAGIPEAAGSPAPRGHLTYADAPRIQYTHAPSDPEPEDAADRRIWRMALNGKARIFASASPVLSATKGPLTAYFRRGGLEINDQGGVIEVVNKRSADTYVRVVARGFEFETVRKIVGSITSLGE